MEYSSKDFHKVSNKLKIELPDRLIHKQVLKSDTLNEEKFSRDRKHMVKIVDLPTVTISMTIGGLEPSKSSGKHRHNYESVIYILEGKGRTVVEDQSIEWIKGDAIYVPSWAWHQHFNLSDADDCLYIACENAPLLQNIGNIALREEAD